MDNFLAKLPYIGLFFTKTYAYWREHIAIANTTHTLLGLGIALALFTRWKKSGVVIIAFAIAIHVVAFLN